MSPIGLVHLLERAECCRERLLSTSHFITYLSLVSPECLIPVADGGRDLCSLTLPDRFLDILYIRETLLDIGVEVPEIVTIVAVVSTGCIDESNRRIHRIVPTGRIATEGIESVIESSYLTLEFGEDITGLESYFLLDNLSDRIDDTDA